MPKNPIQAGTYTGYDSDGNVNTYGAAEHAWIQDVWRQVAERTHPSTSTSPPRTAAPASRTSRRPPTRRTAPRSCSPTPPPRSQQACASQCLGIAFVGTFGDLDPAGHCQPAFVFTSTTMSPIIAAQGAAHEAGHTLGLTHDGTTDGINTQAYYAGHQGVGPGHGLRDVPRGSASSARASTPAPTRPRTTSR